MNSRRGVGVVWSDIQYINHIVCHSTCRRRSGLTYNISTILYITLHAQFVLIGLVHTHNKTASSSFSDNKGTADPRIPSVTAECRQYSRLSGALSGTTHLHLPFHCQTRGMCHMATLAIKDVCAASDGIPHN